MSFNDNVDNFFIILNSLCKVASNKKPKGAITIFVFKNFDDSYNICFGINEEIVTTSFNKELINEISRNNEEILIQNKETLFVNKLLPKVENITEKELNSILFAFIKTYDVATFIFNDEQESVLKVVSNFLVFNCIEIYFSKSIIKEDTLAQYSTAIKYHRYYEGDSYETIKKQILYNHKKGYRKFVDMLEYFELRVDNNPILAAYSFSIDQFEIIVESTPSFLDNVPQKQMKLNNIIKLF